MPKFIINRLAIATIALLAVPATLLAQKEKEEKDKTEKKDVQQIIITRTNTNVKTVIEIDGDKVKVNGKDVADDKGVSVHVNKLPGNVYGVSRARTWNYKYNDDMSPLFQENSNMAMLGVTTEDHAKGAEVQTITKESAAAKIGLKKGDIITKIGSDAIEDADDLTKAVREHKPGEKVTVTYLRDGKQQTATAELGKWKGIKAITNPDFITTPDFEMGQFNAVVPPEVPLAYGNGNFYFGNHPRLGLSIQDTEDGKGVKVLEVDDESNAAKAGIKEDDIILSVDDKDIKGTEDITKIIRENKEKYTFNFKVQRDGKTQNIEVKMPRNLKTTDL
ncbi:MAG: PDZ domain-containing protein [Flavisolibacter sp.]